MDLYQRKQTMNDDKVLKNISESYKELSEIDSFDPKAFIADKNTSQELCDFMLSLALFCNDLKDLMMFNILVLNAKPDNLSEIKPDLGQFNGLKVYLQRSYILLIHELGVLLKKNSQIIKGNEFQNILNFLPKDKRKCWRSIIDILVKDRKINKKDNFTKILAIIRNKTGGHYDTKEISTGYKTMFIKNNNEPYISGGSNISSSRFYFADAAAQIYYYKRQKDFDLSIPNFDQTIKELVENISETFWLLIYRFINKRSPWSKPSQYKIPDFKKLKFD